MAVIRAVAVAALALSALAAWGQSEPRPAAAVPDPRALAPQWWQYIGEAGEELDGRVEALLSAAAALVAEAEAQRGEPDAELVQRYERLRLNLQALPALLAQNGAAAKPAPVSLEEYSLEDYLGIARELRQMRTQARQLRQAIERDEASIRSATRRGDNLVAGYLSLAAADPQRPARGLQIMAARAALAVARQQQRLRQEQLAVLEERIVQFAALQEHAGGAVRATDQQMAAAETRLGKLEKDLAEAQETLRDREAKAVGLFGETPREVARAALSSQQVLEATIRERGLVIEMARLELERIWLTLGLAPEGVVPPDSVQDELKRTADLLVRTRTELEKWADQSEQELVVLRTAGDAIDDKALHALNSQRVKSAEESLRLVQSVRAAVSDAELIAVLAQKRVFDSSGILGGGLAALTVWLGDGWSKASEVLSASLFKIGDTPVTSFGLLRVALIVFVAFWISRLLRHGLERIGSGGEGTQSAFYTVGRLAHYLIITIAIIVGLASIGLNFSNLAIVAGALGVGIGFGLQSIVNNFVSGLILLFEQSLKVGDYVELDSGVCGLVREINVRSTLINTNENLDVLVPNSEFVSGKLTNWTLKEASRRLHVPFGVAYGSDKELVRTAVLEAAASVPYTVQASARKPDVWLVGFGDSSLDFQLIVWVKQASVRRPRTVTAAYNWAIESSLAKYDIEIPFPQRDLHVRSGLDRLNPDAARVADNG